MPRSTFGFDVITSPEEQEAILARLREQARRPADEPLPIENEASNVAGKEGTSAA